MMHWLVACVHLHAVIDRIEPPFAVLEWTETERLGDVPLEWIPLQAKEGDQLIVHVRASKHKHRLQTAQRKHSFPLRERNAADVLGIQNNHRANDFQRSWKRSMGSPTRSFMGADKRRHESDTSNRRVGVSLSEGEN